MSDLIPNPVALNAGLDLSTAKLLVEPGSMIDCLNYEVVEELGYRRIDGFAKYDGNIQFNDIDSLRVHVAFIDDYILPTTEFFNTPYEDADGNVLGFLLRFSGNAFDEIAEIVYIPFDGNVITGGTVPSEAVDWEASQLFDIDIADDSDRAATAAEFRLLQSYLQALVVDLPATAVGLHWWRDALYAVVPIVAVPYEASAVNEPVTAVIGDILTNTANGATGTIVGKIVSVESDGATAESGTILVNDLDTGFWAFGIPATLGGVTVGSGTVGTDAGGLMDTLSDYCVLWKAIRPSMYNEDPTPTTPGWVQLPFSYSVSVTLSGVTTEFNALRRGGTLATSTYYAGDGSGVVELVLVDYFIVSGAFDTGDAVVTLQFATPTLESGTHELEITSADDLFSDAGATTKLGDFTTQMTVITLPGVPSLTTNSSRYEFVSANFYATEGFDAFYGVNGAGRAFVYGGISDTLSLIYTQADATLDNPRHVENHALHLALGFKPGSVQLSVTGAPTNFSGDLGATEIGVGDRVTGLMALPGSTLGVFCEQSIWSIVGSSVDAFDTQVISPKTGCIEYTLANCGEPVFMTNSGITTLATSANYGDFVGTKLSKRVSSWLRPRLRRGAVGTINSGGIACALPVREKSQYRVFFNNGDILTMTLRAEAAPAFTFQKYFLELDGAVYNERALMVPLAWTSQVDWQGKERIFTSHFNTDSPVSTTEVFALENGDSFNGTYITHYFDINWYFGQSPSTYMTLQGLRAFGLSRGLASLNVYAAGPQTDFYFQGNAFSTSTVPLNFPRNNPIGIVEDLQPVTNRADIVARGLAIQVRIAGSNTDYTLIEPTHVVQVLTLYTTPAGAFDL